MSRGYTRRAWLIAVLVLLLSAGVGVAAVTSDTTQEFTYTVAGTTVSIPTRTYTQTVAIPTVTETVTQTVTAPATTTTPSTTTSPTPAPVQCSQTAQPGANVGAFIAGLQAGQTGCLAPGTYTGSFTLRSSHGTSTQPVTLTSQDPTRPALIFGRVVTQPGADFITFSHLRMSWNSGGQNLPSVTIGSSHVTISHDDIQNENTAICINAIDDPTYGTARFTVIDHNRIHNCGVRPVTSYSDQGYFEHGIYVVGYDTTITQNVIYDNADRGVQLRGSQRSTVDHNTMDGNGTGVVFGDLDASGNSVGWNIITNSATACPNGGCNSFGVFSWWGSTGTGTGNVLHDSCLWGNESGNLDTSGGGFTATATRIADPLYTDRAAHDYTLKAGSPCAGLGADGTAGP